MVAPYGLFELADGSSVLIAVQSDREWRAMAEAVLERPDLAADPRFATNTARAEHVDALEAAIIEVLGSIPADEALQRLRTARITVARVRSPIELWHHEQHAARDRKIEVTTPAGTAQVWRSPFNISGHESPGGHVPALGEHDPELVRRLRERG
jgi:itaconate CoA-transferase